MPRLVRVYTENNDFQYVETLRRNRQKRHQSRQFVVEGVRQINQALAQHWTIDALLYARERHLSDWARDILARADASSHIELPGPLLAKLSAKDETSELMALVAMPDDEISRIPITQNPRVVIFDRPASPGNLGTIIRSCDALGIDGMIITGHAVDLYDPETISATTGSFFALPIVRLADPKELLPWIDQLRRRVDPLTIVGSSAEGTITAWAHDFSQPTILVIGNETWGMSEFFRELCDVIVSIPIQGSATSLNVASATSILLYEIERQRLTRRPTQ